jgi:hypothetical protein
MGMQRDCKRRPNTLQIFSSVNGLSGSESSAAIVGIHDGQLPTLGSSGVPSEVENGAKP